ncbi:hypothetical protein [Streptomyces sp. NRRL S-813]|uniref:hypothetical protein n=1 Tax=Streptomyces sp. NRRL S-813 TaxID=1463919 RepID=UPI001F2045B7|nr:hypothetical protein [Streptomyces sp. NRRL S-813]
MSAVTDKIAAEIERLRVSESAPGLAQLAVSLAESIDEADGPTGKANAARELRQVMADLRKLAPIAEEGDTVDDIARQREKRRAAARQQAASE